MESSKRYYGEEIINIKELIESNEKGFIKLEYYGISKVIEDEFTEYGIEVIKKQYKNKQFIEEIQSVKNIAENESDMEEMIGLLKRNKVTPIGLKDIISDLIKVK